MGHLFVWNLKTFSQPLHIHCKVGEKNGEKKEKKERLGQCVTNKISTRFLNPDYLITTEIEIHLEEFWPIR